MTDSEDLTPGYREVVEYLDDVKMASPKHVAEATGRTKGAARAMLSRMHDDGVLMRPLRGYYCTPEVADDLDLSIGGDSDSVDSGDRTVVSNPVGPSSLNQRDMFDEGKRRAKVAEVAKAFLDGRREEDSGGKIRAKVPEEHSWWPMRTDWKARARWWIAEKLAHGIVALIPEEEFSSKGTFYDGS